MLALNSFFKKSFDKNSISNQYIGTTYVDDSAPRRSAPVYVSVVYLIGAIGPAAGYILGGTVVNHWVDPFVEPPVEADDSR